MFGKILKGKKREHDAWVKNAEKNRPAARAILTLAQRELAEIGYKVEARFQPAANHVAVAFLALVPLAPGEKLGETPAEKGAQAAQDAPGEAKPAAATETTSGDDKAPQGAA